MSERGTFVTSFLGYDPRFVGLLREKLPQVCRPDGLIELSYPNVDTPEKGRMFAGYMHGSYDGEEAFEMEMFLLDEIIPHLPAEHGNWCVTVTPEWEEHTVVFSIKDRVMVKRVLNREPIACTG